MLWLTGKLTRIFRIQFAILVALFLFSNRLNAQVRITEKFTNTPLIEALDLISKKYGVKLAYDNSAVLGVTINANFKKESPEIVLKKLLLNSGLEFILINDVFVLRKQVITEVVSEKPKKVIGVVRDRVSGESLPYATVKVLGVQAGTSTNTDGFFSIEENKQEEDSISIRISYIGFEPIEMKVAKVEANSSPMVIELDRKSFNLSDVKVVKEIPEAISVGNRPGELVWNSQKIGQLPSMSGIDVVAPLQMLPGIDGTVETLSGLNVRHSPSDKNLFTYDGFTIYHIDHFFGAFTSFNSKAIKDIRVIRGGFDARWGGRASSVVEITGKTGNENKLVVDAGGDQLSADMEIEGPIGHKTTFVLAARRSFTDFYRSDLYYNLFESTRSDLLPAKLPVSSFTADPSLPKFYYYDANAKLSYRPTSKDNLSISGYLGNDKLSYSQLLENPYVQENSHWGNSGAGFRWSRQWNANFYHIFTVGASDFDQYFNHTDSTLRRRQMSTVRDTILRYYNIDNTLHDISANFTGQLRVGGANTVEGGFNFNRVNINSNEIYTHFTNGSSVMDTSRANSFLSLTYTGWLQNTITTGDLKALTVGCRFTYHNLTSKFYFEPRIQLLFNASDRFTFKFAAGLYNQYVNRIAQYGDTYRSIWVAADGKKFPVVMSKHFIGGFVWKLGSGFLVDFEGYIKNTNGLSFVQNTVKRTSVTKITFVSNTYEVDSRSMGIDILLKKNWHNAEFWVSYSLSRAFNHSSNLNGGDEYYAYDDHLHEIKLAGIYNLGKWRLTIDWIYGTPKPWDEILLTESLQLSPDYEKNSVRLIPYHRLDAGIAYTQKFIGSEIQLGVKGFNLYNRQNILFKPYTLSDTPQLDYLQGNPIIIYQDVYGLGFTPTFYLNIKF